MNQENNFKISFFKPTTARALHNRNMVLWLISIWAIAIFGFQIALRVIEKPTPEPELLAFEKVWENVKNRVATQAEIETFAKSTCHVAGKVFIAANHKVALGNAISWATMQLADSAQKIALLDAIKKFETAAKKAVTVSDVDYVEAKKELKAIAQQIIGLNANDPIADILPFELNSSSCDEISADNMTIIEECMPLYTIHNRSVLTDTTFIGFPFHYFYTAVFLLILFIGLCLAYCLRVDAYNKRMEIVDN